MHFANKGTLQGEKRKMKSLSVSKIKNVRVFASILRDKMTDKKRVALTRNRRYQELGCDISKYRAKNVTALNMATAELLWKMAEDDYERINALRVLSLNSCGIVGIFEVSHNLLHI